MRTPVYHTMLLMIFPLLFGVPSVAQTEDAAGKRQAEAKPLKSSERKAELSALFAPSFPYQNIRVAEREDGAVLIIITPGQPLTPMKVRGYTETLLSRSISLYGAAYYGDFSWERTSDKATVTITRKVTDEPDVVAVSESIITNPKTGLPVIPLTVSSNEMYIALAGNFNRVWKKIKILPDPLNESAVPDLKTKRYPGAQVRHAYQSNGDKKQVTYVVKGSLADVAQFFREKLDETHKTVLVSGSVSGPPSPAEVFGVKTSARVITLTGYTYSGNRLLYTAVTLRRADDPNFSDYIEIEITES